MIVVVRRRALVQVDKIAVHIAKNRPSAAVAFVAASDEIVRRLSEHPLSSPVLRQPNLRQATMTRFPYVVVHRVSQGRVTVLGVFHAARHPSVRSRQ